VKSVITWKGRNRRDSGDDKSGKGGDQNWMGFSIRTHLRCQLGRRKEIREIKKKNQIEVQKKKATKDCLGKNNFLCVWFLTSRRKKRKKLLARKG